MEMYPQEDSRVTEYKGYKITTTDPYGLCVISPKSGRTPEEFKANVYTSPDEAKRAVDTYLRSSVKPSSVSEVDSKVVAD